MAHLIRMTVAGRSDEEGELLAYVDGLRPVRTILLLALALMLANFFFWWVDLAYGALESRQALEAAWSAYGPLLLLFGIGLGLVVPLVVIAGFFGSAPVNKPALTLSMFGLASVLILVGGFAIRYAVVMGGQVPLPISVF